MDFTNHIDHPESTHPNYCLARSYYWHFVLKPLAGETFGPQRFWEFDYDGMVGTYAFYGPNDMAVHATPYWEDERGIPITITNGEGELIACDCLPEIKITGDSKADIEAYIEAVFGYMLEMKIDV